MAKNMLNTSKARHKYEEHVSELSYEFILGIFNIFAEQIYPYNFFKK